MDYFAMYTVKAALFSVTLIDLQSFTHIFLLVKLDIVDDLI